MRNLIEGIQFVQDHIIHFYHLMALDWVDIVSALSADPAKTSQLAQSISDYPLSSTTYFSGVQNKLKAFVNAGQLGPFANGYWGHPAYKLPPEANLMAVAHYLDALDIQREIIKTHAILGGKNPHLQTYLVGGMAMAVDPNSQAVLNDDKISHLQELFAQALTFVQQAYIPDLLAIAGVYKNFGWGSIGLGVKNFLAYGDFPQTTISDPGSYFLPGGVIMNGDLSSIQEPDQAKIVEYIAHSWYQYSGGNNAALQPFAGQTNPNYTGPKPPYQFLDTNAAYSWVKTPRYDGQPMEVGPLARMLVAYAKGQPRVKALVDGALKQLGVGTDFLFSTLGRIAARGIETLVIAEQLSGWTTELDANMKSGDLRIFNADRWQPDTWPATAQGFGHTEAPRGALGHWVVIENGAIKNYQCVVPSTWNASPRDPQGQRGPYEAALVGTPIADPTMPLEILRTVHSFDPCLACAVHLVDARGEKIARVNAT
jgi:Ni,Fe-hydrogenase I large subunit